MRGPGPRVCVVGTVAHPPATGPAPETAKTGPVVSCVQRGALAVSSLLMNQDEDVRFGTTITDS